VSSLNLDLSNLWSYANQIISFLWPVAAIAAGFGLGVAIIQLISKQLKSIF
jgi:hypothetical protein